MKEKIDAVMVDLGFQQSEDGTWWADDWRYDVTDKVNNAKERLECLMDEVIERCSKSDEFWERYNDEHTKQLSPPSIKLDIDTVEMTLEEKKLINDNLYELL